MKLKKAKASRGGKPSMALTATAPTARLCLQALEPRVLLDAAAAKTTQEVAQAAPSAPAAPEVHDTHAALIDALGAIQQEKATDKPAPQAGAEAAPVQVYFIDRSVADAQQLALDVPAGAEVHFIEAGVDGVQFMAQTLQGRSDIAAIHILSHGSDGQLQLGSATLDTQHMLGEYRDALVAIGRALSANGDILIYGCDFAAGAVGQEAVQVLATLTAADVAASTDDTGAQRLGGNWTLEWQQGPIETAALQAPEWDHLMAPPVVDLDTTAAGTGSTAAYAEGSAPVAIAPSVSLTDADGGNMASATVVITNGQTGDVLTAAGGLPGSIRTSYNASTFTLTLTGSASIADYQTALSRIRYSADSQNPTAGARNINVQVNDGGALSVVATAVVNVTAVNDAPAVDLNSTRSTSERIVNGNFGGGTTPTTAGWTASGNGSDGGATVNSTYRFASTTSATLTQTITGWDVGQAASGATHLSVWAGWSVKSATGSSTLVISVGGVAYARLVTGAAASTTGIIEYFNGASGSVTTLTNGVFVTIGIDLPANVTANGDLVFTYSAPSVNGDWISIGAVSAIGYVDSPAGADYTTTYTENGTAVAIAATTNSVIDADNANLQSATIVLTNAQAGDVLAASGLPAGITAVVDSSVPGQITVRLSGSSTLANYAAAIRAVTFSNTTDAPGTTPRIINTTVNDGVSDSAVAVTTVNVVELNDAPVLADTNLTMTQAEDAPSPAGGAVGAGTLVSSLVGGVSDADANAVRGIAITAASTGSGSWWYSTDNGATWMALGAVSGTSA
ncbi:MAG: DUF4347 domain-containing protein, partial [Proteobacteria bacterium]|nr:DUF4347 domain-containing protein [Pseudomonadota bacterium]